MQLENIGKWKIFALESGNFRLDGGAMMGSVPKVLWEKTNKPDNINRIELSMRCLLADDGENVIIVETGIGHKNPKKFMQMFAINHDKNTLSDTLSDIGYTKENITHIILTHLHFDHAGEALYYTDDGELKPTFPNATYYVSKRNWEAGINPSPRDQASYLDFNYKLLEDEGLLELVSDNSEILNGVSTYTVDGHTTGQQLIKISDDDKTVVFCSDLIPLKSHLKLPWIMGYDLNAALTLKEKKKFLDKACEFSWLLFFYHDPKCVAVRIEKGDKYYEVTDEYKR